MAASNASMERPLRVVVITHQMLKITTKGFISLADTQGLGTEDAPSASAEALVAVSSALNSYHAYTAGTAGDLLPQTFTLANAFPGTIMRDDAVYAVCKFLTSSIYSAETLMSAFPPLQLPTDLESPARDAGEALSKVYSNRDVFVAVTDPSLADTADSLSKGPSLGSKLTEHCSGKATAGRINLPPAILTEAVPQIPGTPIMTTFSLSSYNPKSGRPQYFINSVCFRYPIDPVEPWIGVWDLDRMRFNPDWTPVQNDAKLMSFASSTIIADGTLDGRVIGTIGSLCPLIMKELRKKGIKQPIQITFIGCGLMIHPDPAVMASLHERVKFSLFCAAGILPPPRLTTYLSQDRDAIQRLITFAATRNLSPSAAVSAFGGNSLTAAAVGGAGGGGGGGSSGGGSSGAAAAAAAAAAVSGSGGGGGGGGPQRKGFVDPRALYKPGGYRRRSTRSNRGRKSRKDQKKRKQTLKVKPYNR